jgi:hypothetical protein
LPSNPSLKITRLVPDGCRIPELLGVRASQVVKLKRDTSGLPYCLFSSGRNRHNSASRYYSSQGWGAALVIGNWERIRGVKYRARFPAILLTHENESTTAEDKAH